MNSLCNIRLRKSESQKLKLKQCFFFNIFLFRKKTSNCQFHLLFFDSTFTLMKTVRQCVTVKFTLFRLTQNSGIPDDGNLTEIYWTSVNPELRVNLTEISAINGITGK